MLFVSGVVITVVGSGIGEPDVAWLGLFLCAMPLLALVVVIALQPALVYERRLEPPQLAVGEQTQAIITLRNTNPWAATSLELADEAPSSLGGGARFVVARAFGRWDQAVRYAMTTTQRGRYLVGPLQAKAGDPLGLAVARIRPAGDESLLRVTPRVWPLTKSPKTFGIGATGEAAKQRAGQAGQDDVLVREHRHGDDIRRVHWRMSAKQNELMVRLEEHPWDPSALVIADTRKLSHLGEGPTSSLEWTISAATSVSVQLAADRYRIVVAGGSGTIYRPQQLTGVAQRQPIIDAMTDARASDAHELSAILEQSESLEATGSLLVFAGRLTFRDAATLASLAIRMSKPCALVADLPAWGTASQEHEDAVRLLVTSGWAVERYRPGEDFPDVWSRLMLRQAV
ncbi:MAG: DUF58 domain-containing protein [Propionibacterium sp.]|nr:DUF58 domain-containing protein [Propionibacterium sp.]